MKFLILGHNGFIGSKLCDCFANEEILVYKRNENSNNYEPKDLINLLNNKYDFIIISTGSNNNNNSIVINSSILNIKTILNNYRYSNQTSIVFMSSNVVDYNEINNSTYKDTKLICEKMILSSGFEHKLILRIPVIFETNNFKIIKIISRIFDCKNRYNYFVSIENIVKIIEKFIKYPKTGIETFETHILKFHNLNRTNFKLIPISILIKILKRLHFKNLYNKFYLFVAYGKN